jgi:hypothetical protein
LDYREDADSRIRRLQADNEALSLNFVRATRRISADLQTKLKQKMELSEREVDALKVKLEYACSSASHKLTAKRIASNSVADATKENQTLREEAKVSRSNLLYVRNQAAVCRFHIPSVSFST